MIEPEKLKIIGDSVETRLIACDGYFGLFRLFIGPQLSGNSISWESVLPH